MKANVELLKKQNPEFKHYLYDDKMCREFIAEHFDKDVLWSFDKLKPGAYKSDLWRYCILYIHGGIYLDIKFYCANNFKLIELTDKEYYVLDIPWNNTPGIYQAFLSCLPKNKILYKCIQEIVDNCINNRYNYSALDVTGPTIMASFFNFNELLNFKLHNNGNTISMNNKIILSAYNNYRDEQSKTQNVEHYSILWHNRNIYNYIILKSKKTIDLTRELNKDTIFYSGSPSIIENNDGYTINMEWVNYNIIKDIHYKEPITLNSKFNIDSNFNKISDEKFLVENFIKDRSYNFIGIEDIRLFNYKGIYYFIGTIWDNKRKLGSMCSGIYKDSYELDRNIILPTFYDLNKIKIWEKNWSFVTYKTELCVIYNWYPLQIGKIDYEQNEMNIIEIKYNIPEYFKNARGSTPGYIKDNEIWFVLHKAQTHHNSNYQHFFAVFDLNMNLLRYSELFKLGEYNVEFCIGLIVKEKEIILSYSLMDTLSFISTYDIDYINTNIRWYLI